MLESEEHKIIVQWFRDTFPDSARSLRVSTNGQYHGSRARGARVVAKQRGQGAVIGEADIAILLPRGGFGSMVIEYKREKDKKGATDAQIEYIDYHVSIGNCAIIVQGPEAAKSAISAYMAGGSGARLVTDSDEKNETKSETEKNGKRGRVRKC